MTVQTAEAVDTAWTIEDSEQLYRVPGWGDPYFSINSAGHLTVSPQGDRGSILDLYELVQSLRQRSLNLPLLIRFPDILEDRIDRLNSAFKKAIGRYNYKGTYRGVFPVKCNQQRHLVESYVKFADRYDFGLEAGSKPELMIAMAALNTPGALLICNGYKDSEYLEKAILARRLGKNCIIVLEQMEEVTEVIAVSKRLGLRPVLGVRAKLSTKGEGRWGISAGDRAKFGLTVPELIKTVEMLREAGLLSELQLLHFHIGSQISSIKVLKDALREAGRVYVELAQLGADMKYLDVGGGLAVDYDGSKSNFYASKNYNIQNYANDVVAEIKDCCEAAKLPVPTLISESGRALASHQSVLIFDVLSVSQVPRVTPEAVTSEDPALLRNLNESYEGLTAENLLEVYHDVTHFKEQAVSTFNLGYLSLKDRARAEQIYWATLWRIRDLVRDLEQVPEDLEELDQVMASIYYMNLSLFQSAPDMWAIDQLFPILPIHRLDEEPVERGTLADLTCDSDGKIDRFIDLRDVKSVLELHTPRYDKEGEMEPYFLGMFLAGAYQEIMGNLHNLFGDTNAVHIRLSQQGYQIEHVVKGDTIQEVLGYVQYGAEDLVESIRIQTEAALEKGLITLQESQLLLQSYERSLASYTYLSP
ncbi:MAG: biosynthetic arginine decarboxylase [Candidatus Eremiobacteraeota bacterium]|nr:biosynthetic arginine decarboxylase [Candidatus Eremiobacteraeota bacterium]